jgi:hypothetical protein
MRLALHPKVYSDVDAIMEYYERVASRELADDFYAELRRFMLEAAERPGSFAVRARDMRRVNLHRFPTIFCFASSAMRCGSWLFGIIGGIPHWASIADERSPRDGPKRWPTSAGPGAAS